MLACLPLVQMSPEARHRVVRRVTQSGALPVSRDAPGYAAVLRLFGVVDASSNGGELGSTSNGNTARAGETAGVCEAKYASSRISRASVG